MALRIAIIALIVIAGFGQAVLQLWNKVIPDIFGLHPITFWQAVGLLALCWILFGGWRGPASWSGYRPHIRHMTPEQRERFGAGLTAGSRRGSCPS